MIGKNGFIFWLLILAGVRANAQGMLDYNASQIEGKMHSIGAKLRSNRVINGVELQVPYREMTYKFSNSFASPGNRALMNFFLNQQNKCFKYLTVYTDDRFISTLSKRFNLKSAGLKQLKDSLKWVSTGKKKYSVAILPRMHVNGNVKISPPFMLQVQNE